VEHSIAIRDLTKRYGDFTAVSGLTLAIEPGSICGLLGPNGAGKSTTFKCLLGLQRPTSGSIEIGGAPLAPATFEKLAYVPEKSALYESLSIARHLEFYSGCYRSYDAHRAADLLAMFGLDRSKRVGKLSKGQKTAVALILAFSIRPDILVLDEPASGLDPVFQRLVLDLIIEAAAGGATVLFSSHQIGQVERAADRVAIMKKGKLVLDGSVDELKSTEKVVEAIFASAAPDVDGLASDPRVRRIERSGRIIRAYVRDGADAIEARLNEFSPKDVSIVDIGLEDIFLTAVDGRDATIPHGDTP
jgi:ABC-2 type transport system ATP-binding protein